MREESPERSKLIQAICDKNIEICRASFGEKSIFQIRPLYTQYTSKLHESVASSREVLKVMDRLEYCGKEIEHNQFVYKAYIVDCTIAMQMEPQRDVQSELALIFD